MLPVLIALQVAAHALPAGTPTDIRRFVERVELCRHWNGEEPHDPSGGHGMDANLHALRCSATGRDLADLRRRHARDRRALRVLDGLDHDAD